MRPCFFILCILRAVSVIVAQSHWLHLMAGGILEGGERRHSPARKVSQVFQGLPRFKRGGSIILISSSYLRNLTRNREGDGHTRMKGLQELPGVQSRRQRCINLRHTRSNCHLSGSELKM